MEALGGGLDVLMLDSDALLIKPTFWKFLHPGLDLQLTWDGDPPATLARPLDWVCAGFMYVRSTAPSVAFITEVCRMP